MTGRCMSDSLVTILIPVYNVEAYLPQCLDSVTGQTYKHLQIVAIDDGSSDGSWDILRKYASRDDRIEIYHQENQGVAATRNHLLEKVKGEYVLFVDSDDWMEADMVESLLALAVEYDSPFVMCDRVINDEKPENKPQTVKVLTRDEAIHDFLRHEYFIGSLWNKLIRSSLLHNERFHCGISYGEDALFCWRVLQNVSTIVFTNKQLYHYRMNDGSLSHSLWSPGKKGSGHIVWGIISEEANKQWPQYSDIARSRFAIEDMWALLFASSSGYAYDDNIYIRQQNVRKNLELIRKSGLINRKKIYSAYVLAYCYCAGKLINLFL